MCEIQLIKVLGNQNVNEEQIQNFFRMMQFGSYYNGDSFGIFTDDYKIRKPKGFKEVTKEGKNQLRGRLKNANFIIGHNRMATQGNRKNNQNNHPFRTKDFVLVHNGIITNDKELKTKYNLNYKPETDSYIIIALTQMYYDKNKNAIEAIKKTAEELEGSYSVVIYHKQTGKIYYFKNEKTEFTFALFTLRDGTKILAGSTKDENIESLFKKREMIFYKKQYIQKLKTKPCDGFIYEINQNEIREAQTFNIKKTINYNLCGYPTGGNLTYTNKPSKKGKKKKIKNIIQEIRSVINNQINYYDDGETLYIEVEEEDKQTILITFPFFYESEMENILECSLEEATQTLMDYIQ